MDQWFSNYHLSASPRGLLKAQCRACHTQLLTQQVWGEAEKLPPDGSPDKADAAGLGPQLKGEGEVGDEEVAGGSGRGWVHRRWLQTELHCHPQEDFHAPPFSAHASLPARAPLCFPCMSCVWSVVFPPLDGELSQGWPPTVSIGEGEQGAELRGLGTGAKTVTPTFCPDMKDELEIPKTNLYYLLN